ncbi:MAG: hypothetical protein HOG49_43250 [Candidatus Scalindua sp.]|nr:hypothetical protein [Candidatus Scalindua sp.]
MTDKIELLTEETRGLIKEVLIAAYKVFLCAPDDSLHNQFGLCNFLDGYELPPATEIESYYEVWGWFQRHFPVLPGELYKFCKGYHQVDAWERNIPGADFERSEWCKAMLKEHFDYDIGEDYE